MGTSRGDPRNLCRSAARRGAGAAPRSAAEAAVEQVGRDLLYLGILPAETARPVGAARREDEPARLVDAHHRVAPGDRLGRGGVLGAERAPGDELELAAVLGARRPGCVVAVEVLRGRDPEDGEV